MTMRVLFSSRLGEFIFNSLLDLKTKLRKNNTPFKNKKKKKAIASSVNLV